MKLSKYDGTFDGLVKLVNSCKTNNELMKALEKWKVDVENYDVEEWIENLYYGNISLLDYNRIPYILEVFYKSNDKYKFILFCMILENSIDNISFLPEIDNYLLTVWKWKILKGSLSVIIASSDSPLVNYLYLIIINNDPMGLYLENREKDSIIQGINRDLEKIYYHLLSSEVNLSYYASLEVLLDLCTYFNDFNTRKIISKISKQELNTESIIFLIKYQLVNEIKVLKKNIDRVLEYKEFNFKFFRMLDSIDRLDILDGVVDQEGIALARMIDWLAYPTELGKLPLEIKLLSVIDYEGLDYYLFGFTTDIERLEKRGLMLGVAGGYEKGKLVVYDTGVVYSTFKTVKKDYINQGIKLINKFKVLRDKNRLRSINER